MVKKTELLLAELNMIASTLPSKHCRDIIIEAAERLSETTKIAEFYREEAEKAIRAKRRYQRGQRGLSKENS